MRNAVTTTEWFEVAGLFVCIAMFLWLLIRKNPLDDDDFE